MKKMLIAVLLMAAYCAPVKAQTTDFGNFLTWLQSQQAQVGTALTIDAKLYAATWWDAISVGQAGLNVGKAGALDYVDLGPELSVANGLSPRYGAALPIHVGNIWNTVATHLPSSISSHLIITALPNVTIAPVFLWPQNGSINNWTWRNDFQYTFAYRFGGS